VDETEAPVTPVSSEPEYDAQAERDWYSQVAVHHTQEIGIYVMTSVEANDAEDLLLIFIEPHYHLESVRAQCD